MLAEITPRLKSKFENMGKSISYKESTAIAIQAMMSSARKDEYADRKRKINSPKTEKSVRSHSRIYASGTKEGHIKKIQESLWTQ